MSNKVKTIPVFYFLLVLSALSFTSCKTREKLVYFQDKPSDSLTVNQSYTPVFKADDFLSIIVSAEDKEAALAFNLPATTNSTANSGYTMGNPAPSGYLIDANGMVNLPVLGQVKLSGLNRIEATTLLEEKLKDYLKSPVVLLQIQNYKITVLGDVKVPGTYKIPNERITILEALGLAGDLNITGKRTNVLVVRDVNGVKTEYRLDLTSSSVFDSPAYYLTQNDVVYVEPNAASRQQSTVWKTAGPIFISLTSIIITTITLLSR